MHTGNNHKIFLATGIEKVQNNEYLIFHSGICLQKCSQFDWLLKKQLTLTI